MLHLMLWRITSTFSVSNGSKFQFSPTRENVNLETRDPHTSGAHVFGFYQCLLFTE